MPAILTEMGTLLSPLLGAGTVLFFMRRDRASFDARLDEIKHAQRESADEVSRRLERIENNQHRFELSLKDCATRDQLSGMDSRVDSIDRRVAVLEEKCSTGAGRSTAPLPPGGMGGHA